MAFNEDARLLRLEERIHTYNVRFRLALAGYLILALGIVVAIWVLVDQNDELHHQNRIGAAAAGVFCAAMLEVDAREPDVIHDLAAGKRIRLPRDCRVIVRRIDRADE